MGLTDEERARRKSLRTVLAIVATVGVIGYAAGVLTAADSTAVWIIGAVPVVLAILLALLVHRVAIPRQQPPTSGADRDLDATAARRDTLLIALFGATALVQAAAFVVVERPWGRAMAALACVVSLAAATLFWLQRRRVRRSRGLEPASRRAKGHLRRLAGDQEEYTSSSDS